MTNLNEESNKKVLETIKNIVKPPTIITDGSQFPLYEKRLNRWSRICLLTKQSQFDLILYGIDPKTH